MNLAVVGDSITYYVARYDGAAMFAEHGVEAHLDGDPGSRADGPRRWDAWRHAVDQHPDVALFALGFNDVYQETAADGDDEPDAHLLSDYELAEVVAHLARALTYAKSLGVRPGWVNVTERTFRGAHNRGAAKLNGAMSVLCAASGWAYIDWNAARGSTHDTVHPKPDGARTWVETVVAALTEV